MDPNAIKAVNDFFPDSTKELILNPTAKIVGDTCAGLFYSVFRWPIRYGITKKRELDEFTKLVTSKTEQIPEEYRDNSKAGLALKALESARYSLDQNILREMFAELFKNTFDSRVNNDISPLFSTILGNMNHENAEFIDKTHRYDGCDRVLFPVGHIGMSGEIGRFYPIRNVVVWDKECTVVNNEDRSIEFFDSFGVVNMLDNWTLKPDYDVLAYKTIEHSSIFKAIDLQARQSPEYDNAVVEKTSFEVTSLGMAFINAVVSK